ncbi:MAG: hypothetical protein M3069_32605 [Chloroflexota bacterium]|nr:hypothetical protein [Chloroflexota bacterium]
MPRNPPTTRGFVALAHAGTGPFGIVLDQTSLQRATTQPAAFQADVRSLDTLKLALGAYAVALICINDR